MEENQDVFSEQMNELNIEQNENSIKYLNKDQDDVLSEQINEQNTSQVANNVKNHIKIVEEIVASAQFQLDEYKKEEYNLKLQLKSLYEKFEIYEEANNKMLDPQLIKNMKFQMASHREENLNLQKQITDMTKEKIVLKQLILACLSKVELLEKQVGSYG